MDGTDGPPLPVDEQLCGLPELPILRAVSAVHVRRLRLRGPRRSAAILVLGENHSGETGRRPPQFVENTLPHTHSELREL